MKKLNLLSIGLIFLLISSCGSLKAINPLSFLTGNSWTLSTLMGNELDIEQFSGGIPTLDFLEGGRLAGFTGCNNLSGSFQLEGNGIKLDPGAVTRKACSGNGEQAFLSALGKVGNLKVGKDKLTFLNGSEQLMSFVPKVD
jgi:heat shock protein HslJ